MTLSEKIVTIKKKRQCFSCYRIFEIGEKMSYWVGICEGDFTTSYSCLTCKEIMSKSKGEDYFPEGFVFEMLEKGQTPENLVL